MSVASTASTTMDVGPVGAGDHSAAETRQDNLFRWMLFGAATLVLVVLGAAALSMLWGGRLAFQTFGWRFIVSDDWDPVGRHFGAFVPIYGTLATSVIAMLIAVPVSFGIALFLTEIAPGWLQAPIAAAIELLAGIPSIIYGMWGLFSFVPFMADHVLPWINDHLGPLPWIGALFRGPPLGIGMLTAGIVLAIMVVPFISAVTRDVFETVPDVLKESGYGLGATTWEVIWQVVVPYARTGMIGGIMLGLGRALGETMAVTFVIGNAHRIGSSLLAPGTTISAAIANEFTEAVGDLYTSSLVALGALLFLITFSVIAAARFMLLRLERRALSSV